MPSLTQLIRTYYENAEIESIDQKTRSDLKPKFLTGEIPEEKDFMGLIYNAMSFKEDGIFKSTADPLCIQAGIADSEKSVLSFYDDPADDPYWRISIHQGFNIKGGDLNPFRISESGNIGIRVESEIRSDLQIGQKLTFNAVGENFIGYNLYKEGESLMRVTEGAASELGFDIDGTIKIRTIEQGAANSIIQFRPGNGVFFQNDGSIRINRGLYEYEPNSSILLDVVQFDFEFQGLGALSLLLAPQAFGLADTGISNILAFDNQDVEQEEIKLLIGAGNTVFGYGRASNFVVGTFSSAYSNDEAYGLYSDVFAENKAYGAYITADSRDTGVKCGIYVEAVGEDTDFAGYFNGNVVVAPNPDSDEKIESTGGYTFYVDGAAFSAQGWNMEGGDYSELFESEDGRNILQGTAVVFTSDGKIRPADQDEVPIGVVTQSSGITGNTYNEWPNKYLKDEFGNILYEKVEKLIEPGPIFSRLSSENKREMMRHVQVPKINPEFDKSLAYVRRERRPEWNKVGLLGQLPLRKGQPVAQTWSKIKDISDNIELWLVK